MEPEELIAKLVGWTVPDDVVTGYGGEEAVFVVEEVNPLPEVGDSPVPDGCSDAMPDIWGRL